MLGVEHLDNAIMFSLSDKFSNLNQIVDSLRHENRAIILQMVICLLFNFNNK